MSNLTTRETQVLQLCATGLTSKSIAEQLGVGTRVVEYHIVNCIAKLKARNRIHAVALGLSYGMIDGV